MAKRAARHADPLTAFVEERIQASIETKRRLLGQSDEIVAIANVLVEAVRGGHKVIFFGNGGSAADAQHLAAELVGRFYEDRRPLPALALTVDTSALTAWITSGLRTIDVVRAGFPSCATRNSILPVPAKDVAL